LRGDEAIRVAWTKLTEIDRDGEWGIGYAISRNASTRVSGKRYGATRVDLDEFRYGCAHRDGSSRRLSQTGNSGDEEQRREQK
jgi:hypothetical protein